MTPTKMTNSLNSSNSPKPSTSSSPPKTRRPHLRLPRLSLAPLALLTLGTIIGAGTSRAAYCPCYTLSSRYNDHNCGVEAVAGSNPSVATWQSIFTTVSRGPSAWGSNGPPVADIGQGCGKPEKLHGVPATFPCELLKGIAMQESGWRQFCRPSTPADQAPDPERTIISFDCGYGVGQVTSGMHVGETPGFDRKRVASDPLYNMATGASILAGKWRATNCVGDNQPRLIEHWYTATWAYNGLAYSNNPNNPNLDPNRGVYNPSVGGSYTYQERVFGWIERPPSSAHWTSIPLAYPNRANVGTTGSPPDLPEPDCASPTNCTQKRSVHPTTCGAVTPPDMATAADMTVPRDLAAPRDLATRDANTRDLITNDANTHDGSTPTDAALSDAALSDDSDVDGSPMTHLDGGCTCALSRRASSAARVPVTLLALVAFAAAVTIRRRRPPR